MVAITASMIRSLEDDLKHFDAVVDSTEDQREDIITITTGLVKRIRLEDEKLTDPKAVSAVTTILNTALSALRDKEANASKRVTTKIKQAENMRADNTSELVVDILRKLSTGNAIPESVNSNIFQNADQELDRIFEEAHLHIDDIELREDPKDLS